VLVWKKRKKRGKKERDGKEEGLDSKMVDGGVAEKWSFKIKRRVKPTAAKNI
jgi:hypothetical protein